MGHARVLDQREVDVEVARSAHGVPPRIAERAGRIGDLLEARGVEPAVDGRIAERRIADGIGPVVGDAGRQHALRLRDLERESGADVENAAHLPAAVGMLRPPRQLVDPVRAEGVGDVVVGRTAVVFRIEDVGQRHRAVVVGVEVNRPAERV